MKNDLIYSEEVSSTRTGALFGALSLLFFWLFTQRLKAGKKGFLSTALFCLFLFFLFYVFNYRTLIIHLTEETLQLKFGVFTWKVPLENIAECRPDDEMPPWQKFGGAGIHFMSVNDRYRASFNFLEHPRVVIAFNKKVGPVKDISFSTRQPYDVLRSIQEAKSAQEQATNPT